MLYFDSIVRLLLLLILCKPSTTTLIHEFLPSSVKSEQNQSEIQHNIEKPLSSFLDLPSDIIKLIASRMRYYDLINIVQISKLVYKTLKVELLTGHIVRQLQLLDLQNWDTKKIVHNPLTSKSNKPINNINKQSILLSSLAKLIGETPRSIERFHIRIFDRDDWELFQKNLLSIAQSLPQNSADKCMVTFHIDVKPTFEEFDILKKSFEIKFIFNLAHLFTTNFQKYKDLSSLVIFDDATKATITAADLNKIVLPENLPTLTIANEIYDRSEFQFFRLKMPKFLRRLKLININMWHKMNDRFLTENLVLLSFRKIKFVENVARTYREKISRLKNLKYLYLQDCNLYAGVKSQTVPRVKILGIDFIYVKNFNWPEEKLMPELALSYQRSHFGCGRTVVPNLNLQLKTDDNFCTFLKDPKFQKKITMLTISVCTDNFRTPPFPINDINGGLDLTKFPILKNILLYVPEVQLYHLKLPTSIEKLSIHFSNYKAKMTPLFTLLKDLKNLNYLALKI